MLLCLYNILPPFSGYVKSATSSSWGISFFARAKQTLTQAIQPMLFFNVRPASPSLAYHWETNSSNNFHVFVGYIANGSGYPGGVGDEFLLH